MPNTMSRKNETALSRKVLPGQVLRRGSKSVLLKTSIGRLLLVPVRWVRALGYYAPQLKHTIVWAATSREFANFTYDITEENREYMAHTISAVTGASYSRVIGYFCEIQEDEGLKRHVAEGIQRSRMRHSADPRCELGRRVGWYAFVRILKPQVVVETGVDKGLGALTLCAALMRNAGEGYPGRYLGTDINPDAGFLLTKPYSDFGEILIGDSIKSLQSIPAIDVFVNDSDHSADYERREYETIASKLTSNGLILGDNSHCTDVLARFSQEHGRQFIFFREQPKDHWYPGAGIGISFVDNKICGKPSRGSK